MAMAVTERPKRRKRGPKEKLDATAKAALVRAYTDSEIPAAEIARMFGVSRALVHRIIAQHRKDAEAPTPTTGAEPCDTPPAEAEGSAAEAYHGDAGDEQGGC
jgi:transposase-like protein